MVRSAEFHVFDANAPRAKCVRFVFLSGVSISAFAKGWQENYLSVWFCPTLEIRLKEHNVSMSHCTFMASVSYTTRWYIGNVLVHDSGSGLRFWFEIQVRDPKYMLKMRRGKASTATKSTVSVFFLFVAPRASYT